MLIFQTMNSDRSNNLSLKYQIFTPSGCKDIVIRKLLLVSRLKENQKCSTLLSYGPVRYKNKIIDKHSFRLQRTRNKSNFFS